ncbi:MAG: nicotinate-nicotinamide nucleotide adenylyltransferase [Bradymonadales bacterium]|jgi:nicotinate-nucleotide adenylyltransferase
MVKQLFFYGGSFNPPHISHVFAANYLTSIFPDALTLVAPILRHAYHKKLPCFETRYQLLKLAFQDMPRVTISRIEQELNLPNSRTIACIHELKIRYPGAKIYIVIGSDLVVDLPNWKNADELHEHAEFFVFPRPGYPYESPLQTPELVDVSSSMLRERIASGQIELCRGLIPKRVLDYIVEHGLYS